MYRYQQKQLLQRQQAQEEEERERQRQARQAAAGNGNGGGGSEGALHSVYQRSVQPHLMHPTSYHVQKTVGARLPSGAARNATLAGPSSSVPSPGGSEFFGLKTESSELIAADGFAASSDPYLSMGAFDSASLYASADISEVGSPNGDPNDFFSGGSSLASSPPDRRSYQASLSDAQPNPFYAPGANMDLQAIPMLDTNANALLMGVGDLEPSSSLVAAAAVPLPPTPSSRSHTPKFSHAGANRTRVAGSAQRPALPPVAVGSMPTGMDWTDQGAASPSAYGAPSSVPTQFGMMQPSSPLTGGEGRGPTTPDTFKGEGGAYYGLGASGIPLGRLLDFRDMWALEKRRRRRESHNAVERRRRDNINDRITELSIIVPDCIEDPTGKPNKGIVLRKSSDYIRYLQEANLRLQKQLASNGIAPVAGTDISGPHASLFAGSGIRDMATGDMNMPRDYVNDGFAVPGDGFTVPGEGFRDMEDSGGDTDA